MKQEDWKKLCKHIYEGNCILVLGSEFPIEFTCENNSTTFAELLTDKIKEELRSFKRLPEAVVSQLDNKELSQLTVDYLNYKGVDKKISREDLECLLIDYLNVIISNAKSAYFQKLLTLPFTLVVTTNYTKFFQSELQKLDKIPSSAYYNFKGSRTEPVHTMAGSPGTELHPFVYNLFGCIDNSSSLVISDSDLIEFAIKVISKNPGLPANIRNELSDPQKIFLFMGLNFLNKSWYIRTLLQAMESNNKGKMSYAVESNNKITNDDDPALLLFKDELKVSLHNFNQFEFIDSLIKHYDHYFGGLQNITTAEDAPRAFISYKSEDYDIVNEICQRLRKQGINTWIDKERLYGNWELTIVNEISNADAFILMHSQQLINNPVNYVNVEIKEALERSRYYASISDFIFPAFINSNLDLNAEHRQLSSINFYDLTKDDKIDQLARDIKRSFEKNRRKPAA
jgi:hypothetical protein